MQAAASTVHNPRSCRREDLYQVVQKCDYCSAKLKRKAGLKFMLADCIPTQTIATVSQERWGMFIFFTLYEMYSLDKMLEIDS